MSDEEDLLAHIEFSSPRAGLVVSNHSAAICAGSRCCIHNPSEHHMREWSMAYRTDRALRCPTHLVHGLVLTERICPHGVGHPDPDSLSYLKEHDPEGWGAWGIHGCDLCCRSEQKEAA